MYGWNNCIDHLASRGLLETPAIKRREMNKFDKNLARLEIMHAICEFSLSSKFGDGKTYGGMAFKKGEKMWVKEWERRPRRLILFRLVNRHGSTILVSRKHFALRTPKEG